MNNINQRKMNNVFYSCASKPLLVFRFIGLLPIEGLLNPDGHMTRFTLKSLYTIYFGIVLGIQAMCFLLGYYCALHRDPAILGRPAELIMALTSIMVCISLLHLSKNWMPSLRKIEYIETLLSPLRSRKILVRRIKWFICIMLLICLVNYSAQIVIHIMTVKYCLLLEDDSGWYLKSYFLASNSWFYHHVPFSYVSGFIMQIVKLQTIIMCHFADILIVVVTAYLTCRVKNFYGCLVHKIKNAPDECVQTVSRAALVQPLLSGIMHSDWKRAQLLQKGRGKRDVPWHELQVHFTRLTTLVATVDDLISPFIFTSFFSHLLFICKQLFDVLRINQETHIMSHSNQCEFYQRSCHPLSTANMTISLTTLFLRSLMVSLTAARLHTLGREPLNALHFVPTSMYNEEMQRLMDQVYHSKIGLSGLRFFYITRGTVLSMISTILTYELVLLQIKV